MVHEYYVIDVAIVWNIITEDLPNLKEQIISLINKQGYSVKTVTVPEFLGILESDKNQYKSITTELLRFNPALFFPENQEYVFDTSHTQTILEKGNIVCPKIDENLIKVYLDYGIKTGYLPGSRH